VSVRAEGVDGGQVTRDLAQQRVEVYVECRVHNVTVA
jgi:hypothetical protein